MTELDLVFICDTTGSMGSYLSAAKKSIEKIVTTITQSEKCDVRFALVEYRDHPPQDSSFAFRLTDFTASMKEIQRAVDQMRADGGGDGPESVACAFHCASELKYREKATKVAVWIADAPPHGFSPNSGDGFEKGCPCGHDFIEVVHDFMKKGIVVYSVGAEVLSFSYLRTLMRAVAEMTGGQYAALASADVLGDLITAGAIEEIQINKMLIKVRKTLEEDPEFVALNPKEKELFVRKKLEEESDKTEITSVEVDSIFSVEPEAVPDIFKNAENLKQLKKEMVKQNDIVVKFKDGYGSGGYGDIFGCECLECYDGPAPPPAIPPPRSYFCAAPPPPGSAYPAAPPPPSFGASVSYSSAAPMMKQEVKSVKRKADSKQTSRMETRMKSYYGDY
ncbi:VWFA domain-containing protein [Entamoeba marina]